MVVVGRVADGGFAGGSKAEIPARPSEVGKGPNKGKVTYKNVMQNTVEIGERVSEDMLYELPVTPAQMAPGTGAVVVVQEPSVGPIVATARTV